MRQSLSLFSIFKKKFHLQYNPSYSKRVPSWILWEAISRSLLFTIDELQQILAVFIHLSRLCVDLWATQARPSIGILSEDVGCQTPMTT